MENDFGSKALGSKWDSRSGYFPAHGAGSRPLTSGYDDENETSQGCEGYKRLWVMSLGLRML